ncbi:c-type cytochrome [Flavivirga abyssicola]|uniref:c-type cytochrome n=1 Tax=Flavivirga abyssicola TaxID=3063533 RepID=UPI0026DFE7FA|nr:c-type cytochrome [Flavivirga sp. MEBiC07777]WVK12200.1 c-type cytochrome [Flavivirga sp. MEBiC07777]
MNLKKIIYTLAISVLLFNCSSNSNDDLTPDPDPNPDPDPTTKVTYDANVQSIINNNCAQCHGNPTANGAPFSLVTYTSVRDRVDAILSRINNASSPMPPSGQMPSANRNLIQQWKDDGLLEN